MPVDLTQLTLPQWLTSAIGLVVIALVWRAVCAASDELIRRSFPKRRIGNRTTDDAFGKHERSEWMDRLIDAMTANAEVNTEVARGLTVTIAKQDAILEAFKQAQLEQRETNEKIGLLLKRAHPQGA